MDVPERTVWKGALKDGLPNGGKHVTRRGFLTTSAVRPVASVVRLRMEKSKGHKELEKN